MLGLMAAKQRGGEMVIERSIMIDAPVEAVFDLLDFASPMNVLRISGYSFRENAFGLGRYCAMHDNAPGSIYHFEVDQITPNMALGFRSWLECEDTDSVVTESRSDYALIAMGEDRCKLEMRETASVRAGARKRDVERERAAMLELVDAHLERLKLLAEYGADADVAA